MNNYDDACEDLTQMFWKAMNNGHLLFATEILETLTEWGAR